MTQRRAITEREVRQAARDGVRSVDVRGAVVTPSAKDAARALKIELVAGSAAMQPASSLANAPAAESPRASAISIAIGADHGGVALKEILLARLRELGHKVIDLGTQGTEPVDYPDFAIAVAREVAAGRAQAGIAVDGAGIGSCMAANKIRGIRAAMCHDVTTATNAREHNNANMLTLGGGLIGPRLAVAIMETFIRTGFTGGRHAPRVAKIDALDDQR
ncbi:MAG: ribose 5-phosphate isomerase B [Gemmatimonadaceae bacterium]